MLSLILYIFTSKFLQNAFGGLSRLRQMPVFIKLPNYLMGIGILTCTTQCLPVCPLYPPDLTYLDKRVFFCLPLFYSFISGEKNFSVSALSAGHWTHRDDKYRNVFFKLCDRQSSNSIHHPTTRSIIIRRDVTSGVVRGLRGSRCMPPSPKTLIWSRPLISTPITWHMCANMHKYTQK